MLVMSDMVILILFLHFFQFVKYALKVKKKTPKYGFVCKVKPPYL